MSDRGNVVVVGAGDAVDRLCRLLESDGYEAESLGDGSSALATIATAQPNIVVLDSDVPGADPFVLCAEMKEDARTFDIPVVFMATAGDAPGRVRAVELGDDLITTPLDAREVLARVERQVTVSKVRRALQESEAKFRSVMESAIDAIISSDASGNILAWNRAATAIFGFTEEEAIGRPMEMIIPERFRTLHRQGLNRVSSGGPSHVIGKTVELAAVRKNGAEFPVELSLATWFLDDVRYFTGIIRDISERKQAEQKFRSVTESAIDAIISADHAGTIVGWNNAATQILGYTADEAIGQRLELIIPERFREAHRQGMARVTSGGESHVIGSTVELSACVKGGEEVPIELSLSTWHVRDDRYYTGIIRDIRERKRAEEELRLSEQALRESTRELRSKNEALERTLVKLQEVQHQLILQEKMASLGKLSAGMAHELNNPAGAARRSASQIRATFRQLQDAHMRITKLALSREQRDRITELHHETTERETQTAELSAVAQADSEMEMESWMEELGLDDSWQLAPVLVKLGYDRDELRRLGSEFSEEQLAAVIEWLGFTHEIYSQLSDVEHGTSRIAAIVQALKSYTFMDQASTQSVQINEGLDSTLGMFQQHLSAGITVVREYAVDLPVVQAFGSELNQVWTSLIDNAIDAMAGEGRLVVRSRVEDDWVVVEIEDSGSGIPEAILGKIFDPFYTTKPPGDGTGLGLNLSHNIIVRKHQGEISVRSEPGCTCFTVRLPVQGPDEQEAAAEPTVDG